MNAHRIDVFHIADSNAVARTVPHDLILNFLPPCDTALHKYLPHTGKPQAVFQDFLQFRLIIGNASAGAAQRIGRTQHHGITDGIGERYPVFYRLHHLGGGTGFSDTLHQILEFLPPFRIADGGRRRSKQRHTMRFQETGLLQLHPQIQPCLSPQSGKNAVRLLLLNDLFQHLYGQRLYIHFVGDIPICHDGSRVGVHQNNLHPLLLQGTAGLGARIVEFRRLSDNDRPGTDYHDSFYIWILRHGIHLPSSYL